MVANTEIAGIGSGDGPTEAQVEATITFGSVVLLSLAAVGAVVVTKKVVADVRENIKIRREMKALYAAHKKAK